MKIQIITIVNAEKKYFGTKILIRCLQEKNQYFQFCKVGIIHEPFFFLSAR